MRAFVYTVPEIAGGHRSAVSRPTGKQDVNDSTVGTLAERKSITMPLAFESTTTILPESEEATMDDLNKIEVRIDPSFSTQAAFIDKGKKIEKDASFDKLLNFELVYENTLTLPLVDTQFTALMPKGVLGYGFMGIVAAYKLPSGKQIALKLEHPAPLGGFDLTNITPVLDKRCAVQSPVKDITPPNCDDQNEGCLWYIGWPGKENSFANTYNRAYVMPKQSGDGVALFKLLDDQCNENRITHGQYCTTVKELFADLVRQVFCVLKEGYLVDDLKLDNYLYRITEKQKVRIMISDWGLWASAPNFDKLLNYDPRVRDDPPRLTHYVYFLVEQIREIVGGSQGSKLKECAEYKRDVKVAYEALRKYLEQILKDGNNPDLSANDNNNLEHALRILDECNSIAYYFNRVLREHSDEVKLSEKGQVLFL